MKKKSIRALAVLLAVLSLLLCSCEAETDLTDTTQSSAARTDAATTSAARSTGAAASAPAETTPSPSPFDQSDVEAMQLRNEATVADYVASVRAQWYQVVCWVHVEGAVQVSFYDHEPTAADASGFVSHDQDTPLFALFTTTAVPGISDAEDTYIRITKDLPPALLAAAAELAYVDFAQTGNAIIPPRGLRIGDPAQRIAEAFGEGKKEDTSAGSTISYTLSETDGQYDSKTLCYLVDKNQIIQGLTYRYMYHAN